MEEKNLNDLNESIKLLSNYRDRLLQEVTAIAKKLQMPNSQINSTLEQNSELIEINQALNQLIAHRDKNIVN
tara:strand:+ start:211 stop:426 length:216 start_codon:yes stop_codon:yes gene_type:complete